MKSNNIMRGDNLKECYLRTEEGNIFYWISSPYDNTKKTLFFLHGVTGDHTLFQEQIGYFEDKYNILLWDAPAHGKSRPYQLFTYEKASMAIKDIFNENHISRAIFIGHSMGGFVTQAVIKRFPEIVEKFIAVDSTPYGKEYYSKSDVFWLKQVEWMGHLLPMKSLKKAMAKQVAETEKAYNNMLDMLSIYDKKELCHLMGIGYAGFLNDNCDLEIKCPVLLILGDKDKAGKVKKYNMKWTEKTGYRLVVVENAGHNSVMDNPDVINATIIDFIENVG